MQNLTDIKHRIKSIEDTRQITKAMKLISISKMRKAMERYQNNLTYFQKVRYTIKDILIHTKDITHPFLEHATGDRTTYIVIAGEKGLAGGYNHNVLEHAWKHMQTRQNRYIFTVGQMAREFFQQRGQQIDLEFLQGAVEPTLYDARSMAQDIIYSYRQHLMDEVLVVFTRMHSTVNQKPMIIKLLPVELDDLLDIDVNNEYKGEIIYDPSPKAVLDTLVPEYIVGLLYAVIVQSSASEHSSRMLAMENATKNADKMLDTLNMEFNRARQGRITEEISEIVSAASLLM